MTPQVDLFVATDNLLIVHRARRQPASILYY